MMGADGFDQHTVEFGPSMSAMDARDAALASIEVRNLSNELAAIVGSETAECESKPLDAATVRERAALKCFLWAVLK